MTVQICQSFSPNSFGLHFREREETIKEKKAKIRTYKKTYKWAGKIWWEKAPTCRHLAQNFKNNYYFFKF